MKFITKILDKYYSYKLIKELIHTFRCLYMLDFKTKTDKTEVCLYVKKSKYKNSEYTPIIRFRHDEAIIHIARIEQTKKAVRECIETYLKEEN